MVQCIYRGVTGYIFRIKIVFLSLSIGLVFANSADPDEMSQYNHLCLHCLSKYVFRSHYIYTIQRVSNLNVFSGMSFIVKIHIMYYKKHTRLHVNVYMC